MSKTFNFNMIESQRLILDKQISKKLNELFDPHSTANCNQNRLNELIAGELTLYNFHSDPNESTLVGTISWAKSCVCFFVEKEYRTSPENSTAPNQEP